MHPQHPPPGAYSTGQPQTGGVYTVQGGDSAAQGMHAGMSHFVEEIANGGNGLSSLGKMLNLDDSEFRKGALIGAAAVLLLTNESVQSMLFKTGAIAKEAVQGGVEKVKESASDALVDTGRAAVTAAAASAIAGAAASAISNEGLTLLAADQTRA